MKKKKDLLNKDYQEIYSKMKNDHKNCSHHINLL